MIKRIAYTILILFFLSLFAGGVKHVSKGKELGFLTEPLKFISSWTDLLTPTFEELTTFPPQFQKTDSNFSSINRLTEDVIVLMTASESDLKRQVVLKNLRNDSVLYHWDVDQIYERHDRLINPILFENKEVVFNLSLIHI